jgi:hypothetical protein
MVDALVALGYPFSDLLKMTYSDLTDWLDVAVERSRRNNDGA